MTHADGIAVGGVRLSCRVRGDADSPPMVLLHGLGEDSSTWNAVASHFEPSFCVVTLDFRGHGDSDRPGAYSFELMAKDVFGVLDQLGVQTFTLVGHSMGGTVAYLMAQWHPSRIDRLILEDTPPPSPRAAQASPRRPEVDLPFDWAVIPAITDQLNDPDPALWDRLIDITAPTLIIGGGPGSVIPQDSLKEVAVRIPTCSMKTIPVGHHVHKECPEEFNAAVAAFLGTYQ